MEFRASNATLEGSLLFALFGVTPSDVVVEACMFEMGRGGDLGKNAQIGGDFVICQLYKGVMVSVIKA